MIKSILRVIGHQEYLRFGIRDRVIRFFHNPDTAKSEEFIVPFFGYSYRGNFDTFLDWTVFYYGAYEKEELQLMRELLETIPEPVVFDVGANVGHHTLFAAQHSKSIYAFEPFQGVSKKMAVKLHDNKITNVEICDFGLGENSSTSDYFPPDTANTGTGSFLANGTNRKPVKLEIKRGDDFVGERQINKVSLIKMDVEGFEAFALRGLKQTLIDRRPLVIFERLPLSDEKSEEISRELFPRDYRFYRIVTPRYAFKPSGQQSYRLMLLSDAWGYGNLLAVPGEYLERLNTLDPLPAIAHRLKDA